jgi:hypothetical protein
MKKVFFSVLALVATLSLMAQDSIPPSPWKKGGMGSLTFSQVGLWNWQAGGQSNMTLIGNANFFANYKQGTTTWDNSLDLAYGFIKNNFIFDPKLPVTKAEDKIDFNSKFGKKAWSEKMYYAALLNLRTQFAPGYATPTAPPDQFVSKFMSPGYMQFSLGLDYKPNSDLSIFLGPVATKTTIVLDDSLASVQAYGVNQKNDDGSFRAGSSLHSRVEMGANFRAKYKKDIMKNVGLETTIDLFSNYIDRPQNIDVRWTTSWLAKVNKYLGVSFNTDLIYDHDVKIGLVDGKGAPKLNALGAQRRGPVVQFKQVFGVTISYKIPGEKAGAK